MIRKYFYVLTFLTSFLFSQVTFSPSILDFGSTAIQTSVSLDLTINNSSPELLYISNIESSNNQFYALIPSLNIPAYSTGTIAITYYATSNGPTEGTLTIYTDNEQSPTIEVPCSGSGASIVTGSQTGTWSILNSPYNIEGYAEVPTDGYLFIEPGVEVVFSENSTLNVYGDMHAIGDEEAPITFKSNSTDENNGTLFLNNDNQIFKGVIFSGLSDGSKYNYVSNLIDFEVPPGESQSCNENNDIWTGSGHEFGNCWSNGNNSTRGLRLYSYDYNRAEVYIQTEFYYEDDKTSSLSFDYKVTNSETNCRFYAYIEVNDSGNFIEVLQTNNGAENSYTTHTIDLFEHPDVNLGDYVKLKFYAYSYNNDNDKDELDAFVDNIGLFPRYYNGSAFEVYNSSLELENCIIEGNTGYGLKSDNSVDIDFSTIINNTREGVSISSDGFSSINNSVIYFNDEQNFRQIQSNSGILNLEYSNVQGLSNYGTSGVTQGAGNIESNPVFVDNMGRLSENSSCVDAASPWLTDMMMPPGLGTTLADMGAYGGPGNGVWIGSEEIPSGNPTISNIVDIPQDQGGYVGLQYEASIFDYGHSAHDITHYSFWRELSIENSHFSGTNPNFTDLLSINREEYWEHVGEMTAQGFENYGYTAPTLADTNNDGEFISTFIVIAHTPDDDVFFISAPASGQSIDNLAPLTPMMLSGDFDSGEISLVWSNFVDQDFSYFNLYRNEELYSTVLDSQYVDLEVPNIPELFYSVSAVDHNGNESPVSQEIMVQAHLMGDLNDDFQLNILDVVGLMEFILGFYEIEDLTYADLNEDSNVDILDVISLVTIILDENGM